MIKDSGNRTKFKTGAVRDLQSGKGRFDLVPLLEISGLLGDDVIIDEIREFKNDGDTEHLMQAIREFIKNSPYKMILETAIHFEEGATKYGPNNWQKGIPISRYMDSGMRHYFKYKSCETDERHDRAFVWNLLCAVWTMNNKPEQDDYTLAGIRRMSRKKKGK